MADRPDRLTTAEIERHLVQCPDELHAVVYALRHAVLATAPQVCEAIKFNALCYFNPIRAYGAIGGNVCMIECHKGRVELSFIHGAGLSDPQGLLRGSGKAKRHVSIDGLRDARRASVRALIRAAVAATATGDL